MLSVASVFSVASIQIGSGQDSTPSYVIRHHLQTDSNPGAARPLSLCTSMAAPITSWVIPEAWAKSGCMERSLKTEETEETETRYSVVSVDSCSFNP